MNHDQHQHLSIGGVTARSLVERFGSPLYAYDADIIRRQYQRLVDAFAESDQTGGGKHALQATAANQPRIVNAGVFDGQAVFDGSASFMKITSFANGTPYFGLYTRVKQSSSSTSKVILEASTNFNWLLAVSGIPRDAPTALPDPRSMVGRLAILHRNTANRLDDTVRLDALDGKRITKNYNPSYRLYRVGTEAAQRP